MKKEAIYFKRRNVLDKHFVITSNVLLYGYKTLSAEAKITFQIINSYDWEDKETGESKGYVFPAIETLAEIRGTSTRTIYRHVEELIVCKLLTRQQRNHQSSYLFIEDISEEEKKQYLEKFVYKNKKEGEPQKPIDKNGNREEPSRLTKMAIGTNKEDESKKDEINVNANFKKSEDKKRHGMQGMKDIMKRFDTVQPPPEKNIPKTSPAKEKTEEKMKRDYFAEQIATELQDERSLGCYRVIAEKVPQPVIFATLGSVKELWREGKIKKSRGALFVDLIKTYCDKKHIDLHFSERAEIVSARL